MGRIYRGIGQRLTLAVVAAVLGLAGCGVTAGAGAGGSATASGSAPHTPTPAPALTAPVIVPTTTEPGGSIAGVVAVTVDQREYSPTSTIVVTVTNGSSHDVFAANHQTACTIVQLEHFDAGTWNPAGGCSEGIMAILVPVRAGAVSTFQLAPGGGMVKPALWAPGTYRASLRYTATSPKQGVPPDGTFTTAYSVTFTVG